MNVSKKIIKMTVKGKNDSSVTCENIKTLFPNIVHLFVSFDSMCGLSDLPGSGSLHISPNPQLSNTNSNSFKH